MGLLNWLFGDSNDEVNETSLLVNELAARERSLSLTAEYDAPTMSEVGETTAVFPYTLYNDGQQYGRDTREFLIPDDGLAAEDSPLVQFVADKTGVPAEEVQPVDVAAVEGCTTECELNEHGRVVEANCGCDGDDAGEEA